MDNDRGGVNDIEAKIENLILVHIMGYELEIRGYEFAFIILGERSWWALEKIMKMSHFLAKYCLSDNIASSESLDLEPKEPYIPSN